MANGGVMKMIVIFGGAFNPPTIAHYEVAKHVLNLPNTGGLIFVPVGDHYQKAGLIPAFHRVKMLEIMISDLPNTMVSKIEIEANHALKTIETLEKLQAEYPTEELAFIMGADNLSDLVKWYKYEQLVKKFKMIIVNRSELDVHAIISKNFPFAASNFIVTSDFIKMDISSSQYRADVTKAELLRLDVAEYIKTHGLYGVETD